MKIQYSGIMTTYQCSASCAHCLYCSSPKAGSGHMDGTAARRICETLRHMGVRSMHIGGGEPFLDLDSLRSTLSAMRDNGIAIDYIETNAFWFRDAQSARELIRELNAPIMVSVDPFHIEFVPLERPLGLIRLLEEIGWDHFVWQDRYVRRLSGLDKTRGLPRAELRAALGENYLMDAAHEYGLSANGRALTILRGAIRPRPAEELLDDKPCMLLDGVIATSTRTATSSLRDARASAYRFRMSHPARSTRRPTLSFPRCFVAA